MRGVCVCLCVWGRDGGRRNNRRAATCVHKSCIHVYTNMRHTDAYGIRMFSPSGATSTHFRCHIDTSSVRACLSRVFEYICILCVCVFGVHVYTIHIHFRGQRTNDTSPVCASLSRMWQCVPKVYLKCT